MPLTREQQKAMFAKNQNSLSQSQKIDLAFQPSKNGKSVKPFLSEFGDKDDGFGLDPHWNRESRTMNFYNDLSFKQKIKFSELADVTMIDPHGQFDGLSEPAREKLIQFNTKTIRFDGWKGKSNTSDFDRDRFRKKYPNGVMNNES